MQNKKCKRLTIFLHCSHVVLWFQEHLQDFGSIDNLLQTVCRNGFASDAVHLVEGVRLENALVRRADEDLQSERLFAFVAAQLRKTTKVLELHHDQQLNAT